MHFSFHEIKTDYTQKLAEYIHHLRYEDLPAEVTDRAKKIIMQTIGVALAAPEVPLAKAAISGKITSRSPVRSATATISTTIANADR